MQKSEISPGGRGHNSYQKAFERLLNDLKAEQ
jgi:hypothetical protein